MTFFTYFINGSPGHGRMVGTVGRMAVVAGVCHLVAEFCRFVAFESCFVALAADVTFLTLEQPIIITGVRRMAGYAAVIFIANKVIMG